MGMLAGAAVLTGNAVARAALIPIPNGDFMSPDVSTALYLPEVSNWHKGTMPDGYPGGADAWYYTAGVFYNNPVYPPPLYITNMTSTQAAFLSATPQAELYQELTTTYQAGQSYHLDFGLNPTDGSTSAAAVPIDSPLYVMLYYLDGSTRTPVPGAETTILNSQQLLGDHNLLKFFAVDTGVVQATDAWAGKAIGIQFLSKANDLTADGMWDLGDVKLTSTSVPEAGTLGMLAAGAALLARRRRK